jgi:hypothetical protein
VVFADSPIKEAINHLIVVSPFGDSRREIAVE